MNKEKFLDELRHRLTGLRQDDIDERVAFYGEMVDDRMEDGISEEDAVAEIGNVDVIVEQIMSEMPLTRLVREKVRPKKNLKSWQNILLVICSPVWIPLVLSLLAVLLSVYVVVWSAVFCIYAVDFSLVSGIFAGIIGIFVYLNEGNPAGSFFSFGIGLVCAGLAILLFFFCIWITKSVIRLTGSILMSIKTSFIGKGA